MGCNSLSVLLDIQASWAMEAAHFRHSTHLWVTSGCFSISHRCRNPRSLMVHRLREGHRQFEHQVRAVWTLFWLRATILHVPPHRADGVSALGRQLHFTSCGPPSRQA
jgi:hypothetical protein